MATIDKQAVLYVLMPDTQYECKDCSMFIPEKERCTIHGEGDTIKGHGSCGYFIKGKPHGDKAMGMVTKRQSGYTENQYKRGYSCKRCAAWIAGSRGCKVVDKNSTGDTPGEIHPNACCNSWKPHPVRAMTR